MFVIPTGDDRAGVGQVVATYGQSAFYFAVFDLVVPLIDASQRAREALSTGVKFLALSMDAKLHAGHWTVVATAPVDAGIPLPGYKEVVELEGSFHFQVVDHSGQRTRTATPSEVSQLPNRTFVAPVRLEKALRADLGLEPWLDHYAALRIENVVSDESLFSQPSE